ncbi:hypothetical protein ACFCVO_12280 [Agromyces sp. NPDC056379]|uniref:hypothetical protein n=1 Tax=unclassified Agromyces TaxID=2639701 RepID=UPI0035DB6D29
MLCARKGVEQAEARRVRESVPAGSAARAAPAAPASPTVGAAAVAATVVPERVAVLIVFRVLRVLPRATPVAVPAVAAVPVVPLLAEVLGPALQPSALLIAAHRHEGLLDQRDRVVRGGARGIRP